MSIVPLIIGLCTFQLACCLGLVWFLTRGRQAAESSQHAILLDVAKKVQCLAVGVAADVGRHDHEIKAGNEALQALSRPEKGTTLESEVFTVIDKIVAANHRIRSRLAEAERALAEQADLIQQHAAEARTDPLTGLANRRVFDSELGRLLTDSQTRQTEFCLSVLDLDHFKAINDEYGHAVGDEALKSVAAALGSSLRSQDTACRFGGEEFAVLLPGVGLEGAQRIASRLLETIASWPTHVNGGVVHLTASLGLAQAIIGETADTLFARTDKALYNAKNGGRDAGFVDDGALCRRFTGGFKRKPAMGPAEPAAPPNDGPPAGPAARTAPDRRPAPGAESDSQAGGPPLDKICDTYEQWLLPASESTG